MSDGSSIYLCKAPSIGFSAATQVIVILRASALESRRARKSTNSGALLNVEDSQRFGFSARPIKAELSAFPPIHRL